MCIFSLLCKKEKGELEFSLEMRSKPFIFQIRTLPNGNWSDLIDCSRSHFFQLPLYSENGALKICVNIRFAKETKEITLSETADVIPLPKSFEIEIHLQWISIEVGNMLECVLSNMVFSKRKYAIEWIVREYQVSNLIENAVYPMLLSHYRNKQRRDAFVMRMRTQGDSTTHFSKIFVSFADSCVELDYLSMVKMSTGFTRLFESIKYSPSSSSSSRPSSASSSSFMVDEIDFAPFSLTLSWENPKGLIPLQLWDNMLSIRSLKLKMPPLRYDGCSMSGTDVSSLFRHYIKEAFVGQTVRILGSLDVVGNPSGVVDSLVSTLLNIQTGCMAALSGDGVGVVEGISMIV